MAIDVTTFAADLPAGTYTEGDVVQLKCTSGPAIVRSGRGAAYLKRVSTFMLNDATGAITVWKVSVKNSDWVDPATSFSVPMNAATAMDVRSGAIQAGHDCPLTPNSSWEVIAVCTSAGTTTTTVANSITAEIEIDYPSVSAITDPTKLQGMPASIDHVATGVTINAAGSAETAKWETFSVDIFKAGYEYALEKIELTTSLAGVTGYVAISNAAGMGGLTRIIPISNSRGNIRPMIEYASKLVKGPMDISYKLFVSGTATTSNLKLTLDFVKRRI